MMATPRTGKPYIWVTWLAKLLGGDHCVWSAWFKAHHKYEKYQERGVDLAAWTLDHDGLMAARTRDLRRDGWTVTTEDQNAFKLEGARAVVAGKPDIVATKDGQVLVVDGKTGKPKDADVWQVLFYLFALPKARPDLTGAPEGEIQYERGDERIALTPAELTADRMHDIVSLITVIAGSTPPAKVPSRSECQRCDIGTQDCPQRVMADAGAVAVPHW